ncbi:MAG: hypothetical protein J7M39_13920 [Anaerolineae bacterium]|nr:hypothetical protein [Anaerolineae bacterium]
MTLWQRFVQGMTAFSLKPVISIAAGLLQARLVFFYLSPADYGQLNVYLSFFATGSVFLGLGLGRVLHLKSPELVAPANTASRGPS